MISNKKRNIREMSTEALEKRLEYLRKRWPKKETREMKYIKYHLKKRG